MYPAPSDAAIIATNDDAFESKVACSNAGYFSDAYLRALHEYLGGGLVRRPPLINRGTALRVELMKDVVRGFVNGGEVQIVSLGAGFDTMVFDVVGRMKGVYVEVDLREVVRMKKKAVMECGKLRGVFESVTEVEGGLKAECGQGRYELRECDLRRGMRGVLGGLKRDVATLVLAEIVLVYMDPMYSDGVLKEIREYFDKVGVVVVEHIGHDDGFGKEMVKNIALRGSPLLGIEAYGSVERQRERFQRLRLMPVNVMTMLDLFRRRYTQEEALTLNRVELLDEVEEWNLLLSHYGLVFAGELAESLLTAVTKY